MSKKKNQNNNKYEKIKIFTLGNQSVGKSCFISKFVDDYFSDTYLMTAGMDNMSKTITLSNGKTYSVIFWDTAGQEMFKSISLNSIKKADGVLLLYDITEKKTFDAIPKWMEDIKENKGLDFPIILLGNKCDLSEKRQISKEDGEELAKEYGIKFYETSNKDGTNIKEVGFDLINQIAETKSNQVQDFVIIDKKDFKGIEEKSTCNC